MWASSSLLYKSTAHTNQGRDQCLSKTAFQEAELVWQSYIMCGNTKNILPSQFSHMARSDLKCPYMWSSQCAELFCAKDDDCRNRRKIQLELNEWFISFLLIAQTQIYQQTMCMNDSCKPPPSEFRQTSPFSSNARRSSGPGMCAHTQTSQTRLVWQQPRFLVTLWDSHWNNALEKIRNVVTQIQCIWKIRMLSHCLRTDWNTMHLRTFKTLSHW